MNICSVPQPCSDLIQIRFLHYLYHYFNFNRLCPCFVQIHPLLTDLGIPIRILPVFLDSSIKYFHKKIYSFFKESAFFFSNIIHEYLKQKSPVLDKIPSISLTEILLWILVNCMFFVLIFSCSYSVSHFHSQIVLSQSETPAGTAYSEP